MSGSDDGGGEPEDPIGALFRHAPPSAEGHARKLGIASVFKAIAGEPAELTRIGRLKLLDKVGVGGMGSVYRAFDPDLGRHVAVKLLRGREGTGREQQLREARTLARLAHPGIVTVHDVGVVEGRVFIVMEYVDGETIDRWVKRVDPTWEVLLGVLSDIVHAVSAAHETGIVHCDLKPANLLVNRRGKAKVVDFGLASWHDEGGSGGSARGWTRRYAAPEVLKGLAATPQSDQYSLCVTFGAVVRQHLLVSRGADRAHVERLLAICERGRSPDPGNRWPGLEALAAALDGLAASSAGSGIRPGERAIPDALQILHETPGFVLARWRTVFINAWQRMSTLPDLDVLEDQQSRMIDELGRISTLTLYSSAEGSMVPSPEVRRRSTEQLERFSRHWVGNAQVIALDGFAGAAVRAYVTGLGMLAPASRGLTRATKVFRYPEDAVRWLAELQGQSSELVHGQGELTHCLDVVLSRRRG